MKRVPKPARPRITPGQHLADLETVRTGVEVARIAMGAALQNLPKSPHPEAQRLARQFLTKLSHMEASAKSAHLKARTKYPKKRSF